MSPRPKPRHGAIVHALTHILGTLPLAGLVVQEWYVDVQAPGCPGTGTQADPFCTLMDAVAAAADGDTIHIAPGTYFENVLLDKDLSLIGTGGDQVTILDGSAGGRVVHVSEASVTLTGLTLTNGATSRMGGGLYVKNSACYGCYTYHAFLPTTLISCSIVGNSASWDGGGIGALYATLSLSDCEVRANASGQRGGGLWCWGQTLVADSILADNSAAEGGGFGGGWNCYRGCPFVGDALTLTNSTVSGNQASLQGGGIHHIGSATISEATVISNTGSGILSQGAAVLENLVVSGNTGAGIEVGGLVFDSLAEVRNSLLVGNGGAGLLVRAEGQGFVVNSTLSGNGGTGIAGDAYAPWHVASIDVTNSILWGNALGSFVLLNGATAAAEHSLAEGGWPGTGNIDQDPLFVDPLGGDYRLLSTSPCIDAGDNTAVPLALTHDLRGVPRFIDDPLTPDSGVGAAPVVDMGAYEFFRRFRDARGVPVPPAPPRTVR